MTRSAPPPPAPRVFRAAVARRAVWHWTADRHCSTGPRSACLSWPLDPATARGPVSVDIADRCRGNGCRQRWDDWLRGLVRACLLAQARAAVPPAPAAHPTRTATEETLR